MIDHHDDHDDQLKMIVILIIMSMIMIMILILILIMIVILIMIDLSHIVGDSDALLDVDGDTLLLVDVLANLTMKC